MLQVICAYIEMVKKTKKFICNFVLWLNSLTSTTHSVRWLSNKSDSKFCECLLMLEQISVEVLLCCVDLHNNSSQYVSLVMQINVFVPNVSYFLGAPSEKSETKSLLRRSACIFQQFRWQDTDFDLHISTCRGDYRILLHFIRDIVDDEFTTSKLAHF